MYKDGDEIGFDGLLKDAFGEYARNQVENEPTSEELEARYPIPEKELRAAKKLSKKAKRSKKLHLVYLQRAGIIALVCICALFTVVTSSADEVDYLKLTADLYRSLVEKVEYIFGSSTIAITKDFRKYDSLNSLMENEDLNGALLPLDLDSKYSFESIEFRDFGDRKDVDIKIVCDDELVCQVTIHPSRKGNFIQDNLVSIGRFDVIQCQYDDAYPFDEVYQFEFNYGENSYCVRAVNYDILMEITESLN